MDTPPAVGPGLRDAVGRWVDDGLISAEQGERILVAEGVPTVAQPARTSLVTEALAYVGGVIVLAAVGWVTAQYWSSMTSTARLALSGSAAVLLLAAGAAVPPGRGDVATRLRSVLWLLSTGALAWFCGLLAAQRFEWSDDHVALFVSLVALGYAAALWWRLRVLLQEVAAFAALVAAAAAVAGQVPGAPDPLPGVAVAGVGVGWLLLSWAGRTPSPRAGLVLGGVAALAGAVATSMSDWGDLLTGAVLVLLLVVAVRVRSLALLAVTAVGALLTLPRMMNRYFAGSLAVPLVLVVVGLVMIAVAVRMTRREGRPPGSR